MVAQIISRILHISTKGLQFELYEMQFMDTLFRGLVEVISAFHRSVLLPERVFAYGVVVCIPTFRLKQVTEFKCFIFRDILSSSVYLNLH